ncbi:hypothetical protein CNMCM8980_001044 [Aspergillus fumigatiaffinis]|nr:hypothetical protein CNMCM8980_001044 [Aspergillus fumigatiaffinis]
MHAATTKSNILIPSSSMISLPSLALLPRRPPPAGSRASEKSRRSGSSAAPPPLLVLLEEGLRVWVCLCRCGCRCGCPGMHETEEVLTLVPEWERGLV